MLLADVVSAFSSTSSNTLAALSTSVRRSSGSITITASSSSVSDHGTSATSSYAVSVCFFVATAVWVVAVFSVPGYHATSPSCSGMSNGFVGMFTSLKSEATRVSCRTSRHMRAPKPVGTSSSPLPTVTESSAAFRRTSQSRVDSSPCDMAAARCKLRASVRSNTSNPAYAPESTRRSTDADADVERALISRRCDSRWPARTSSSALRTRACSSANGCELSRTNCATLATSDFSCSRSAVLIGIVFSSSATATSGAAACSVPMSDSTVALGPSMNFSIVTKQPPRGRSLSRVIPPMTQTNTPPYPAQSCPSLLIPATANACGCIGTGAALISSSS